MKKIILLLSLALFAVHTPLFAKRAYIEYPDKITIEKIEYKASYEMGNFIQKPTSKRGTLKQKKLYGKK